MTQEITNNTADLLDSRNIIDRFEELEADLETLTDAIQNARETLTDFTDDTSAISPEEITEAREALREAEQELADWDDADEYRALKELCEEAEGYSGDWPHGATLIRDSYFTEYAQKLAENIGAITRDIAWPACHIDWEEAADSLKQDYTSVEFDGVTYWVR